MTYKQIKNLKGINVYVKQLLLKHRHKIYSIDFGYDWSIPTPHLLNLDDGWICDDSHIHYFGSYDELESILESAEKENN